jgi:hypothetical protein
VVEQVEECSLEVADPDRDPLDVDGRHAVLDESPGKDVELYPGSRQCAGRAAPRDEGVEQGDHLLLRQAVVRERPAASEIVRLRMQKDPEHERGGRSGGA